MQRTVERMLHKHQTTGTSINSSHFIISSLKIPLLFLFRRTPFCV